MADQNIGYSTQSSLQYCILTIGSKLLSSKKEILVDFGQQNSSIITANELVIEETAKVKGFYALVDALNYMASIGWKVVHIMPYTATHDGVTTGPLRYLMERTGTL